MDDASPRAVLERLWTSPWGFHCMVARNPLGFRMGYVCVQPGHPWYGVDAFDVPAAAHGGLNYSGDRSREGWLEPDHDGIPPGWWLGFDCGHAWDSPDPEFMAPLIRDLYARAGLLGQGHVWTTDDVAGECEALAFAAAMAAGRGPGKPVEN